MIWWKKMLVVFGLFVVWLCGLIIVGEQGYPSQYFWLSMTILAVGFAVAPFWRLRGSVWFWPTTVLIEVANLALLYTEREFVANSDLPSKGVIHTMLVIDVMGSWAVMAGVCWLFNKRFPWQLEDESR